jgi:glycosyltransferase involved in cell wall biosynthesis
MVTSSYPKFPGDVTAPFIESIARAVVERGHSVDIVLPEHPELRRPPDEPVRFFPYRYAPSPAWSLWGYAQSLEADVRLRPQVYLLAPLVGLALRRTVASRLIESRYDVVHAHWLLPNAALVVDVVQAHRAGFVVSLHGSDVFVAERLPVARSLARWALTAAGAVTACSGDLHRRALALGAQAATTRTVPYGVDLELFSPASASADEAPPTARTAGKLRVFAFGRLVEKKGFEYLVEAAAQVPGIEVVIVGEGDLREQLSARARALAAPVTLPGALERVELATRLAMADVVVVPSVVDRAGNVDGLPNALLEALAAGRPVVASRVAGIPEVLMDGHNGLLVPPRDTSALAAALGRLCQEPELRARLGRQARTTALERLSWQAAARAFEQCYVEAAALETD